jgi:hypothetical protein
MLSIESLHALQIVTDYQAGALSPFLKAFSWFTADDAEMYLGEEISRQISLYINMFLGNGVEDLSVCLNDGDPPLHIAAVQQAVKRLHLGVKDLKLCSRDFIQFCAQFPWPKLE